MVGVLNIIKIVLYEDYHTVMLSIILNVSIYNH